MPELAPVTRLPKYDILRERTKQRSISEGQEQEDALKRRFASLGGLSSGSYLKASQTQADTALQRRQEALQDVDLSEQDELARLEEIEKGRTFAREERVGGQDFQAVQSDLQRKFASGERLSGQDFANLQRLGSEAFSGGQADLQRKFATSERLGGQEFATGERRGAQEFAAGESKLGREQQAQQFADQLALESRKFNWTTEEGRREAAYNIFNAGIAAAQQDDSGASLGYWLQWADSHFNNPDRGGSGIQMLPDALRNPNPYQNQIRYEAQDSGGE